MNRRLLAVAPVDDPRGAEIHLLRLLAGLAWRGWAITLTTPRRGRLARAGAERLFVDDYVERVEGLISA